MNSLKQYIEIWKNVNDTHQVIEYLKNLDLSIQEKNLIYLYLFPRPLLDMELPGRIQRARRDSGNNGTGYLEPNVYEISLLVEAYRTQQYRRFIKHLLHCFTDPKNIHPVNGYQFCECGLCKKRLFELGAWNNECSKFKNSVHPEETKKEFLAYGADGSNITLCIDCIIQLQEVNRFLEDIEPGYLCTPWIQKK